LPAFKRRNNRVRLGLKVSSILPMLIVETEKEEIEERSGASTDYAHGAIFPR